MRKDDRYRKLGDFAKVLSGYAFKSKDFRENGVPVIKIKNIRRGYVDLSTAQFIRKEFLQIDEKYHVVEGDILISLTGSHLTQPESVVGRVARYQFKETSLLNQRAGKVLIKEGIDLNKRFLFYVLSAPEKTREIALMAHGAASQANVSPSAVESLSVFLPNRLDQDKIASIVSCYDDLIENNTRRIQILEEMCQRIYREWFVDFRFPGHEKVKLVDSEMGKIPEDWEVKPLGEVIAIVRGKNLTKQKMEDGLIPVISAGISPSGFHSVSNVKAPAVTISASGANAGYIGFHMNDIWASDCSFFNSDSTEFIFFYYLSLLDRQVEVTNMQRGAAQPHVYPKDIMELKIIFPPENVIKNFDEIAESFFKLIGNLKNKNENLKKSRNLLLPQLISGELDVSNIDMLGVSNE